MRSRHHTIHRRGYHPIPSFSLFLSPPLIKRQKIKESCNLQSAGARHLSQLLSLPQRRLSHADLSGGAGKARRRLSERRPRVAALPPPSPSLSLCGVPGQAPGGARSFLIWADLGRGNLAVCRWGIAGGGEGGGGGDEPGAVAGALGFLHLDCAGAVTPTVCLVSVLDLL